MTGRPGEPSPLPGDDAAAAVSAGCRLCGTGTTERAAEVVGKHAGRRFELRRCPRCGYVFVADPLTDLGAVYDEDYYRGKGADPTVDYVHEADHPSTTVRTHEWRGILDRVRSLTDVGRATAWLDYGCGVGGLVRYLHGQGVGGAAGYEHAEGWPAAELRRRGIPHLVDADLRDRAGSFDVVTAIEVVEHVFDPVAELGRMRALLRPGGLLFLTTGNSAPFRDRLAGWRYCVPEMHVSFYEPRTLALGLEKAGFEPAFPGFGPGWVDIYRFKLLKAAQRDDTHRLEVLVPWSLAARMLDRRLQLSAQPIGWAR